MSVSKPRYRSRYAIYVVVVFGCSLAGRVWGDDAPAIELKLREVSTAVFAGSEVELPVDVQGPAPTAGKLVWRHAVATRTLSAGEIDLKAGAPLTLKLKAPTLAEGVSLETQLTLNLVADEASLANFSRTLWIFSRDPFIARKEWLKELGITLFDPGGQTEKIFEDAQIPITNVTTLGALEGIDSGLVVVGEGIDLKEQSALGEVLLGLARRGIRAICLAPVDGDFPHPSSGDVIPSALHFEGDHVVAEIDKRLSADVWTGNGKTALQRFVPTAEAGELVLRVSRQRTGWSWLEATYAKNTKLILCGYPIIKSWNQDPTGRYLFAKILEKLETKDQPPSRSN